MSSIDVSATLDRAQPYPSDLTVSGYIVVSPYTDPNTGEVRGDFFWNVSLDEELLLQGISNGSVSFGPLTESLSSGIHELFVTASNYYSSERIDWRGDINNNIHAEFGQMIFGYNEVAGAINVDIAYGSAFADEFRLGQNNDFADGGDGDDLIDGGTGADVMIGGSGNDTYYVDNSGDIVVETAGTAGGTDTVFSAISFSLAADAGVEALVTTRKAGTVEINLNGNDFAQSIGGNAGNNVIKGFGGNDVLSGFGGNDTLDGGAGSDTLSGGTGNDVFYVDNSGDQVVEAAGSTGGSDTIFFSVSFGLGANAAVETLASSLKAGTAAINISGNNFNQTIGGNNGVNILNGVGGNDILLGNGGNDRLFGGLGNDTLLGGAGNDLFFFNSAANTTSNHDVLADFGNVSGNNDTIYLDHTVFTSLATGSLGEAFAITANGAAAETDDRIIYNLTNGNLYYDANGTVAGGSVLVATLTGHPTLGASDFVVY